MKIFLATLAVVISLIARMVPKYTLPIRRKKVVSKKANNYIYQSLKARIYTLQVLGTDPTSYDYPDN